MGQLCCVCQNGLRHGESIDAGAHRIFYMICAISLLHEVFDSPALARARASVQKAQNFQPREKMWIQRFVVVCALAPPSITVHCHRALVEKIVNWCEREQALRRFGYLYLFAYIFLLRLPSEALPATKGKCSGTSRLFMEGDSLILQLERR